MPLPQESAAAVPDAAGAANDALLAMPPAPAADAKQPAPQAPAYYPKVTCRDIYPHLTGPISAAVLAGFATYTAGNLLGLPWYYGAPPGLPVGLAHGYLHFHYDALPAAYPNSSYVDSKFDPATRGAHSSYSRCRNVIESLTLVLSTAGEMLQSAFDATFKSGGSVPLGVVAAYVALINHAHAEAAKLVAESGASINDTYFGLFTSLLTLDMNCVTSFFDFQAIVVELIPLLRAGIALGSGYTLGGIFPPLLPAGIAVGWFGAHSEFRKSKDYEQGLMQESIGLRERMQRYNYLGNGFYYLTHYAVKAAGKVLTLPGDLLSVCLPPPVVTWASNVVSGVSEGVCLGTEGRDTLVESLPFLAPIPTPAIAVVAALGTSVVNRTDFLKAKHQRVNETEIGTDAHFRREFTAPELEESSCGRVARARFSQLFCCGNRSDREPLRTAAAGDAKDIAVDVAPVAMTSRGRADEDEAPRPSACAQFWNKMTCVFFCGKPKSTPSATQTSYQHLTRN